MLHELSPGLVRKFSEPGGLFDTVLQRLVSEWHRFQADRDAGRLTALRAILEATLAQLESLELLLEADRNPGLEEEPQPAGAGHEPRAVRSVYAAEPSPPAGVSGTPRPSQPDTLSPERLDEATRLLESLQAALQEALAPPSPPTAPADQAPSRDARELPADEARRAAEDGSGRPRAAALEAVLPRETFDVAAAAELKRCRRFERSFSLVLLDVGMDAEPQASRVLLGNLREFDLVGRYGNTVFAVGLPETSAEGARLITHRLVGLLARRGAWSERGRFGISTYPNDGTTLTTVVRSAREQLGTAP